MGGPPKVYCRGLNQYGTRLLDIKHEEYTMMAIGRNIVTCSVFHMKGLQGKYTMFAIGRDIATCSGCHMRELQALRLVAYNGRLKIQDLGFRVLTVEFGVSSFTSDPLHLPVGPLAHVLLSAMRRGRFENPLPQEQYNETTYEDSLISSSGTQNILVSKSELRALHDVVARDHYQWGVG